MKRFHIGDGSKSIRCDPRYESDGADGDIVTFTRADRPGFSIKVSVISVRFKEGTPAGQMRDDYREKARKLGLEPVDTTTTTYYLEPPAVTAEEDQVQYGYAAIENHVVIFSLNFPSSLLDSAEHRAGRAEMEAMIASLELRAPETASIADITLRDSGAIRAAVDWLARQSSTPGGSAVSAAALQAPVNHALAEGGSPEAVRNLGLCFGELLCEDIEGFEWKALVDDDGLILCLKVAGTTIMIFPTAMIAKRLERAERFDVGELAESTIDTIEELVRKGEYNDS